MPMAMMSFLLASRTPTASVRDARGNDIVFVDDKWFLQENSFEIFLYSALWLFFLKSNKFKYEKMLGSCMSFVSIAQFSVYRYFQKYGRI